MSSNRRQADAKKLLELNSLMKKGELIVNENSVDQLSDVGLDENDYSVPMTVVSNEEAEEADFVVCTWVDRADRPFPAIEATCHDCDVNIIHSLGVPKGPIKICVTCAIARVQGGKA